MEDNKRIQGENQRLRKELKEARSQGVQQPVQMPVQGSAVRDEVRQVLFQENNVELEGYILVQTPEAYEEDRPRVSMELQRPDTSEQQDLIEVV